MSRSCPVCPDPCETASAVSQVSLLLSHSYARCAFLHPPIGHRQRIEFSEFLAACHHDRNRTAGSNDLEALGNVGGLNQEARADVCAHHLTVPRTRCPPPCTSFNSFSVSSLAVPGCAEAGWVGGVGSCSACHALRETRWVVSYGLISFSLCSLLNTTSDGFLSLLGPLQTLAKIVAEKIPWQ